VPTERHGTLWGLRVGLDGEITYLDVESTGPA
jgi:hypothetical protein